MTRSEWPSLKMLDVSENSVYHPERYGMLDGGRWPLLECLYLRNAQTSPNDIQAFLYGLRQWPSLKEIHFEGLDPLEKFRIDMSLPYVSKFYPNVKIKIS